MGGCACRDVEIVGEGVSIESVIMAGAAQLSEIVVEGGVV